ncbi:6-phosphogluconolactonase [Leptospira mtsangambouensis]|uniref:6-phosphogluconolactonase n=1 Tax=Leptospira mtsangambouensis TaxID=2484912 RepID=A0ABY2P4K5_9LEPT|nr:6-phosphogluconolactonase [Leptospira mtsangambouensis]TGM82273.1 6-phosphogluconolactonase [Leptospira mtsangambouensis]
MYENISKTKQTKTNFNLIPFETKEIWISKTIDFLYQTIQEKLSSSADSPLHILLSGGNTPIPIYKRFSELDLPWYRIHFWLADERCVSKNDIQRSETEIRKALGSKILDKSVFHSIPEGDPISVAKLLEAEVENIPEFIVSFLGIGEDGHTASLFPGFEIGETSSSPNVLAVYNSPKPPSERISLSVNCINRSEHIVFLAAGPNKKSILEQVMSGKDLPASKVRGRESSQIFFCME